MVNKERLIQTFFELIQVDSETGNEKAIAEFLKNKFSALGLKVEEDDAKRLTGHGANNLIGTLPGQAEGSRVFFGTHMDTVVPGKRIQPSIKEGRIVSDGTTILGADDKAGLAAVLEALQIVQEKQIPHADVQVVVTVGEESGLLGAKALDTSLIRADYGYALDSDGPVGDIVIEAPNQAKLKAEIFGKTSHAGIAPEKGISAITIAAKAIAGMPLGRIDQETTANIGRFEGGKATNIVCDYVHILAEARSLDRLKLDQQVNRMTAAFQQAAKKMNGRVDVQETFMYPGYRFREEEQIVQLAKQAITAIGRIPRLLKSGGGSDANVITGKGIPTLNLGVGYEKIHTTKEQIAIAELVKTSELVLSLMNQAIKRQL
ncbi:M20/M25/M40 family metallo-hydrolase [Sporolactobacillus sp. THM7-7]|nr:M20/M25/M40 family metallo-hydrolase [Sporolactobacillus sp. THM7-7]